LPDFDYKEILNIIKNDKKVISGSLHFILLENIGSAVVQNNISDQSIISVLEAL
jgi:3-dehydroquinate synthetase